MMLLRPCPERWLEPETLSEPLIKLAMRNAGGMDVRVECYSKRFAGKPCKNDFGERKTSAHINSYRSYGTGRSSNESTEQERKLCSMDLVRPVGKVGAVLKDRY